MAVALSLVFRIIADVVIYAGLLLRKLGDLADFFEVSVSKEFLVIVVLLVLSHRRGWILGLASVALIFYLEGWTIDPGLKLGLPDLTSWFNILPNVSGDVLLTFH